MYSVKKGITKICDQIILWSLAVLVFLLPLFFLPFTPRINEFSKQLLLFFLILVAYLAWFGKGVLTKKLIIRRTPLDIPILIFVLITILSTVFSVDRFSSILGAYGQGANSLLAVAFYALLYFIVVSNINSPRKITRFYTATLASVALIIVYNFLQTFGIFTLPFQFTKNAAFNPVGSFSGLLVFLAFGMSLAVALLLKTKLKLYWRITVLLLVLADLLLINTINFRIGWYVTIVGMFIILGLGMAKTENMIAKKWLAVPAFILIIAIFGATLGIPALLKGEVPSEVSLGWKLSWEIGRKTVWTGFFDFLFGSGAETFSYGFSQFRPARFNQNILWNVRFDKANNSYAEQLATTGTLGMLSLAVIVLIFLGSTSLILVRKEAGYSLFSSSALPAVSSLRKKRFPFQLKFGHAKKKDLVKMTRVLSKEMPAIQTPTDPEEQNAVKAPSAPRTAAPPLGTDRKIINLKSRTIKESEEEEEEAEITPRPLPAADYLPIGLAAAWFILLVANFINSANTTLQLSFWLAIALIMALTMIYKPKEFKKTELSFRASPKYALVLSFTFVIALSVVTILFTYLGRIYLADVYHHKGLGKIADQKIEEANPYFQQAIALNKYRPIYHLALAQNLLTQANLEAAKGNAADLNKVQVLLGNSINESKLATDLVPQNVNLWEARSQIYENTALYSRDANEWVIKSYQKAQELEPTNPIFAAKLGRAYMIQATLSEAENQDENYKEAEASFQKATELKPDYLAAHYYLALVYEKNNQINEALNEINICYQLAPQNEEVVYEVGRLSYNKAMLERPANLSESLDFQRALGAFNVVLQINPNHANAHYSLGLAYESLGEKGKALAEMRKVQQFNPENQQLQLKIEQLESAVAGTETVRAPETPAEETTPPAPESAEPEASAREESTNE